jgi:hypothetical protein
MNVMATATATPNQRRRGVMRACPAAPAGSDYDPDIFSFALLLGLIKKKVNAGQPQAR